MNEEQQNIIDQYVTAYNNFDVDGMTKHLDEHIVFENISNGQVDLRTEGLEVFKQQAEAAKQYFREREQSIKSWSFEGRTVRIEIDYKAVLAVDLPNGLKADDVLELKGSSIFEFKDEKVVRLTDVTP